MRWNPRSSLAIRLTVLVADNREAWTLSCSDLKSWEVSIVKLCAEGWRLVAVETEGRGKKKNVVAINAAYRIGRKFGGFSAGSME